MSGSLYVFSGLDGAGKSTQIDRFAARLREQEKSVVGLWSRGGYTSGMLRLKKILRSASGTVTGQSAIPSSGPSEARTQAFQNRWVRRSWQTLAVLDLIWLYCVWVRWKLWTGSDVICDRYWPDTELDFQINFPADHIHDRRLWKALRYASPRPDAGFLMLVPVEVSLRRSEEKQEPFPDDAAVLLRRLTWYQEFAAHEVSRERCHAQASWHIVDGTQPIDDVADQIAAAAHACTKRHQVACP